MRGEHKQLEQYSPVFGNALLVDLTLQDEVRGRARERGRASDAGRVTHTQTHPFGQELVLQLQRFSLGLLQ